MNDKDKDAEGRKKPETIQVAQRFREKIVSIRGGVEEGVPVQLPLEVMRVVRRLRQAGFESMEDEEVRASDCHPMAPG